MITYIDKRTYYIQDCITLELLKDKALLSKKKLTNDLDRAYKTTNMRKAQFVLNHFKHRNPNLRIVVPTAIAFEQAL